MTGKKPKPQPRAISSVQLLSCVRHFVTPWTEAHQASLSITNSQSLLKLRSIESVMPSNHLILCNPLLLLPSIFPSIKVFSKSQFFTSGSQCIEVSALASVLPKTAWSHAGWEDQALHTKLSVTFCTMTTF